MNSRRERSIISLSLWPVCLKMKYRDNFRGGDRFLEIALGN